VVVPGCQQQSGHDAVGERRGHQRLADQRVVARQVLGQRLDEREPLRAAARRHVHVQVQVGWSPHWPVQ
jgi:hypothetical protein